MRTPNFSNKIFNKKSFIRDKRDFCRVKSKFFERICSYKHNDDIYSNLKPNDSLEL